MIAPAHMQHGSSVTTSVQSVSRHVPNCCAARRIATISACAVGSSVVSRSLWPAAMMRLDGSCQMTQPIGTSLSRRAAFACSIAAFMKEVMRSAECGVVSGNDLDTAASCLRTQDSALWTQNSLKRKRDARIVPTIRDTPAIRPATSRRNGPIRFCHVGSFGWTEPKSPDIS